MNGSTTSSPDCRWREKDGIIRLTVISDGTTGPQWIERLESKGFRIASHAQDLLRNDVFRPTRGITTDIAVLKRSLFAGSNLTTHDLRAEAVKRCWFTRPKPEVACLLREKLSTKDLRLMGLQRIVVMHDPIMDDTGDAYSVEDMNSNGALRLLNICHDDGRRCWLEACRGKSDRRWNDGDGFAFAVPLSTVSPAE